MLILILVRIEASSPKKNILTVVHRRCLRSWRYAWGTMCVGLDWKEARSLLRREHFIWRGLGCQLRAGRKKCLRKGQQKMYNYATDTFGSLIITLAWYLGGSSALTGLVWEFIALFACFVSVLWRYSPISTHKYTMLQPNPTSRDDNMSNMKTSSGQITFLWTYTAHVGLIDKSVGTLVVRCPKFGAIIVESVNAMVHAKPTKVPLNIERLLRLRLIPSRLFSWDD